MAWLFIINLWCVWQPESYKASIVQCNARGRKLARLGKCKKKLARLQEAERAINRLVEIPVHDNQFAALCCLMMDIGTPSFKRSRLLRYLNEGRVWDAANEFHVLAERDDNEYKQRRRRAERKLFLTPSLVCMNRGIHEKGTKGCT